MIEENYFKIQFDRKSW